MPNGTMSDDTEPPEARRRRLQCGKARNVPVPDAKQKLQRRHSCGWLRPGKVIALLVNLKLRSICAVVYQPAAPYMCRGRTLHPAKGHTLSPSAILQMTGPFPSWVAIDGHCSKYSPEQQSSQLHFSSMLAPALDLSADTFLHSPPQCSTFA